MNEATPVLVANAPLSWTPRLAALAERGDPLLAADGGANHLARIGLRPAAVIGDFDSLLPETRAWLGERALVERADQDRTDLEKAVHHALVDLALPRLAVLAATGGRIDHTVANLGLLARLRRGRDLVFVGAGEEILALEGEISLTSEAGETWSFWTFDPAVSVTLDGVRWPVSSRGLDISGRPSISNVAAGRKVRVRAEGGAVVIMRQLA